VNGSIPPRLPTWLLEHFASGADTEAILGDLAERYRAGKSSAWYWRQALVAIVVLAYSNNSGRLLIGSVTGITAGAIFIAENIVRNDPHLVSGSFISLVVPASIVYLTARRWRREGRSKADVRTAVRRVSVFAALVFGLSHGVFSLWWFSRDHEFRSPLMALMAIWPLAAWGAVGGFLVMLYILRGSGYVANKVSGAKTPLLS
jgi:hypothetical protein